MNARFHHAHLFASDLDASLEFYRRWLGAEIVADHEFAGARNIMVAVGDGRLNFYDQQPPDGSRNAVHHLGFQIEGLAELVLRMTDSGVAFRSPIRQLPELDYIMVEAPDGVLLELFEYKATGGPAGLDEWFRW